MYISTLTRNMRRIGRRGFSYLMLGLISLVLGLGSIGQSPSEQARINTEILTNILPLHVWYVFATMAGLFCWGAVFIKSLERLATGVFVLLYAWFSFSQFAAEISVPGANRAWVAGVLYGGLATWMFVNAGWRENWE